MSESNVQRHQNIQCLPAYDNSVLSLDLVNDDLSRIEWHLLQRLTLFLLSRRQKALHMTDPQYVPRADIELAKRHQTDKRNGVAKEKPKIMSHLAPLTRDDPKSIQDCTADAPPPNPKYQDALGHGRYTWGVKLNVLVAGTWQVDPKDKDKDKSGLPASKDPHPQHEHKLMYPVASNGKIYPEAEFIRLVKDEVAWQLLLHAKVMASVADPNEDLVGSLVHERFVEMLAAGDLDYDMAVARMEEDFKEAWMSEEGDSPPPPFRELPYLAAAYERYEFSSPEAAGLIEHLYGAVVVSMEDPAKGNETMVRLLAQAGYGGPKSPVFFTPEDIRKAVGCIPALMASVEETRDLPERDVAELQKRVRHYMEAAIVTQRRKLHARENNHVVVSSLPFMKHRYLTFSVSHDDYHDRRAVSAAQYEGCPNQGVVNPLLKYRWAPIEVSSPVFDAGGSSSARSRRPSPTPQDGLLARVCDVLRYRVRSHHCALPTLNLTTSVYVGCTEGFTLLELKKLVTLWVLVESDMARLHRGYRATFEGKWTCASVMEGSRLAAVLSTYDTTTGVRDPDGILPHNPPRTNAFWRDVMNAYIPTADLFAGWDECEELFLRAVWQYTSISDLARALETTGPPERMAMALRCGGGRQRTSHVRSAAERDARLAAVVKSDANNTPPPFMGEIDRYGRGVIEFRQMGQSLDAGAIVSWAGVVENVVRTARETTAVAFGELVWLVLHGGEDIPVWQLLDCNGFAMRYFEPKDDGGVFFEPIHEGTVDYNYPFYKRPGVKY
ncbi:hypothetical protein F5Y17DRAFT_474117 [Xylariaceae sp. FL0594]|nr:hypothetical protein F5Y17DRAFT_474117 [Xylariaceae sp. FL0594]